MRRDGKTLESVIFGNESRKLRKDEEDAALIQVLFHGFFRVSGNKISHHFLSSKTNPTEREARTALARFLLRGPVIPRRLRLDLAGLFAPDQGLARAVPLRTVVFKNAGRVRGNWRKDQLIAILMKAQRDAGLSYDEAAAVVAESQGMEVRHVKKIYGRMARMARKLGAGIHEFAMPYTMADSGLWASPKKPPCPRAAVASDR